VTRAGRVLAEATAAWRSFLRRRTAVFFTFLFPVILVVIFGVLVETRPAGGTGGGLFTEPPAYYLAGYIAVVVLFTPLSRIGSEVARHRAGNRFEKLATTPLSRAEWLAAHTLVNVAVIGLAALLVLGLVVAATGARVTLTPVSLVFVALFVVLGVALFCGLGAVLGRIADSQDGVVAASNAIALPLLFLSETFVPASLLPSWFPTWLSPLTYFARGVRAVTYASPEGGRVMATFAQARGPVPDDPLVNLAVLAVFTVVLFAVGASAIPRTD